MAPGLRCLVRCLSATHRVTVVAPDRNRSGASNSLTLLNPVRVVRHDDGVYCVDGTPTDCVHLALTGLLEQMPEMVVSGINAGANLGDDTLYSGTVAAAMEGRHLGTSAIAVSVTSVSPEHYATAASVTLQLIDYLQRRPLPVDTILNVNVPDIPATGLKGLRVTRLGNRHRAEGAQLHRDPRGRPIWWIGGAGKQLDSGSGTDFHAVANGFASITPLVVDLTDHQALEGLRRWAQEL